VTVLFFLLIVGLMVLSLLNMTHLELRMSQNYALVSQQFQAAEAGLSLAEARLASLLSVNNLHEELNYAGYQVYYEIQRLPLPFCFDQQLAYYYRITAQAKQRQQHALKLQTTYAKKINETCTGKEQKLIKEGRSSWRELCSL
jgi:Tfp pilus assembly protein PilX